MTEKEYKTLCKFAVENGNHNFTQLEKETLKQAIDSAKTVNDLILVLMSTFFHN